MNYFMQSFVQLAQLSKLDSFQMNLSRKPDLLHYRDHGFPYFLLKCVHIYIYMLWCYYLGQVWPFEVLLSGPSLFLKTLFVTKHYKNRGFSTFFWKKDCARKFEVLLSGPSWSFLRCSQLGPNNNTYLAQIITPQNAFFFQFFAFKILLKYRFL